MPVTTKTFYNMTVLNILFAASAVLLALTTILAVVEDWYNEYRIYQVQSQVWESALTHYDLDVAVARSVAANLGQLESALELAQVTLATDAAYADLVGKIADRLEARDMIEKNLQLFVSGNINPVIQKVEYQNSLIQANEGGPSNTVALRALEDELTDLLDRKRVLADEIARLNVAISEFKAARAAMESTVTALFEEVKELRAAQDKATELLKELDPDLPRQLGEFLRDAPLATWMNPKIKPIQTLPPGVKTEFNLLTSITIDRCQSCHVNIDKPQFAEENLLVFLERKVADDEGQNVVSMGSVKPVVLLDFWEATAARLSPTTTSGAPLAVLKSARTEARAAFNRLLSDTDVGDAIPNRYLSTHPSLTVTNDADLAEMFAIVQVTRGAGGAGGAGDWQSWYAPLSRYERALRRSIEDESSAKEMRALKDVYRHNLIARYNENPGDVRRKQLSPNRAHLAHPRLDLIAHPDSTHSVARMGCTSCHGGSGEETQFKHTAHAPANIWVDRDSGMLVPDYFIDLEGSELEMLRGLRAAKSTSGAAKATPVVLRIGFEEVPEGGGASPETEDTAHPELNGVHAETHDTFHDEYWFADPKMTADTYGPGDVHPMEAALYVNPVTGKPSRAVRQRERWEDAYGWEEVHFHIWERPMHELRFVESSCVRCHGGAMEIDRAAPTLAKGRRLFAERGCIDCHPVEGLGSPLRQSWSKADVRQIGPNLAHVERKLSEDMIGSWILAPKALRPSTKMPHIWFGENGSSPIDIRRTRAEVQAAAHYLAHSPDDPNKPSYEPEPIPEGLIGNAAEGRRVFKTVGCLGCHGNVHESGLDWVTLDVMERFNVDKPTALTRMTADAKWIDDHADAEVADNNLGFFELDSSDRPTKVIRGDQFTRLHWYLMAYQPERMTDFGPELSVVGTKLLADRSPEQARAWLYDWVRNPTHYSDYTRMPQLRLTEQEALDVSAYLLKQVHPTYEVEHFETDELMVDALLINMQKNSISEAAARSKVAGMTLDEKVMDLGQRVIQFQGCFGCHQVPGFKSGSAVSANLSAWGVRDPHKLDFGYFDSVYDDTRPAEIEVWTTYKGGAFEDAIHLDEDSIGEHGLVKKTLAWEHLHLERRGYLESKLLNPRIFDRNRSSRDGAMTAEGLVLLTDIATRKRRLVQKGAQFVDANTGDDSGLSASAVEILDVGDPYSKLRMPQFFLKKSEVEALVTYVTSLAPSLVSRALQDTADEMATMRADGKLMAISLNCYGCHNVENNIPTIAQYFERRNADGSLSFTQTLEEMVNAPPRLVGNGAKTRHDWFYTFLGDIEMIRPWLKVRMPSFNLTGDEKSMLVEFLAGQTKADSDWIAAHLEGIDTEAWDEYSSTYELEYRTASQSGQMPVQADTIAKAAAASAVGQLLLADKNVESRQNIIDLANVYGLYSASQTPNDKMRPADFELTLGRSYYDLRFLRDAYAAIDFPLMDAPRGTGVSDVDFLLGKMIVEDLQCLKCHVLGDWDKLERIFVLEQAELQLLMGDDEGYEEGDDYGDDDYGDEGDDDYGDEDEGYGDEGDDEYGAGEASVIAEPSLLDNISAPNFELAINRLQADYIRQWLRKPQALMPGSKMPNHWGPDGNISAFAAFPEPLRSEKEALYGSDPIAQMDLIINFFMAASSRGYTYNEEMLAGVDTVGSDESSAEIEAALAQVVEANRIANAERAAAMETLDPLNDAPDRDTNAGDADETPSEEVPAAAPVEAVKQQSVTFLDAADAATQQEDSFVEMMGAGTPADGRGRIAGFALFTAEPRAPRKERVTPECRKVHSESGMTLFRQSVIINENRTLQNVVVRIVNAPEIPVSNEMTHVIDQIGCQYLPHVITITAGESVTFRNGDPFTHNLNLATENNQGFNLGQPVKGMTHEASFGNAEVPMKLKCDVHSWMTALLYVFDHGYHGVTDADGMFVIDNVPPGDYELEFIHERFGSQTVSVTVEAGQVARADSTYPN